MSRSKALRQRKQKLRSQFRRRRDGLDEKAAFQSSARVCRRLANSSHMSSVRRLGGYAALGNEVDVRPFLRDCEARGVDVFLPRVTGPGQMEFCQVHDWNALRIGSFGIEEPTGPAVPTDQIDTFLVPALAFDLQGGRLGFGKGYYDRILPPIGEAIAVGVGHHWQLCEEPLPTEAHDRPMDHVVTDRSWQVVEQNHHEGGNA